jgi:hypothetical protein
VNSWALVLVFAATWFLLLGLVWAILTVGGRAELEQHDLGELDVEWNSRPRGSVTVIRRLAGVGDPAVTGSAERTSPGDPVRPPHNRKEPQ